MSPPRPIQRLRQEYEGIPMDPPPREQSEQSTKEIDILSFEAATADMWQLNLSAGDFVTRGDVYASPFQTHSCSVRIFKILDENFISCGYLHWSAAIRQSIGVQTHRELVALSLAQYPSSRTANAGAVQNGHSSATKSNHVLFDHEKYKRSEWCLLNVMLIEWKGNAAERITIGQMHTDAWNQLKTERKQIRLG